MTNQENLTKQIIDFLDNSPLPADEAEMWKERVPQLEASRLEEFFGLLKQKVEAMKKANDLFLNIAYQVEQDEENSKEIPKSIKNFDNLNFDSLNKLLRGKLVSLINNKGFNVVENLDHYFSLGLPQDKEPEELFKTLQKSLLENQEILFPENQDESKNLKIGDWLKMYNSFNDSEDRSNLDRLNFVNQNEKTKSLNNDQREALLKLLKVFDFVIDPENYNQIKEIIQSRGESQLESIEAPETEADRRKAELLALASQYPAGSLERKAVEEEISKISKL